MVVLLLAACSGTESGDLFFGSDGRYEPPGWGADTASDTAGTDTADTSSSGGDPGAPVFSNVVGSWEDYANQGTVLQVTADYTDDGDDLDGGNCYIDATYGSDGDNFDGSVGSDSATAGVACVAQAGKFLFALKGLDPAIATHVEFQAKDSSGNLSELNSVDVDAQ